MSITRLHFLRSCFFLQLLFFSGCVSKIATVQQNIDRYKDQSVSVRGKVQETLTIPGIQTGIYQIKDNSGQIWVISSHQIPKRGERVLVKGTVSTGIEVLGKKFGTVIREID